MRTMSCAVPPGQAPKLWMRDRPILGAPGGGGGQGGYKPAGPSRRMCQGLLSSRSSFISARGVTVSLFWVPGYALNAKVKCPALARCYAVT